MFTTSGAVQGTEVDGCCVFSGLVSTEATPGGQFLFCGATTIEALYKVIDDHPEHPLCRDVIDNGLPAMTWSSDITKVELDWIKKEGNRYQEGWDATVFEMIEDVPVVLADWEEYETVNNIERLAMPASGAGSFYSLQKTWFEQKYLKEFGSYLTFLNLKKFLANMEQFPFAVTVMAEFKKNATKAFDRIPGMKQSTVAMSLQEVSLILKTHFTDLDDWPLQQVLLAALELCYPRAEGQYVLEQWVLNKNTRIDMLKGWRAPMGGSLVAKKRTKDAIAKASKDSPAEKKEKDKKAAVRANAVKAVAKTILKKKKAEHAKAQKARIKLKRAVAKAAAHSADAPPSPGGDGDVDADADSDFHTDLPPHEIQIYSKTKTYPGNESWNTPQTFFG